MKPELLLAQLRALLERTPDFEEYSPTSKEHLVWLGQANALISRWDILEASSFRTASDFLPMPYLRDNHIAKIYGIVHRAVADLELKVPADTTINFGPGAVYDFFRELNELIASAETSIFIIDPYLDHTVFDHYLNARKPDVTVRLLLSKGVEKIKPATDKYIGQFGEVLEVKSSKGIHDRVIFIDNYVCWVLGQSVKDAAKAKPTYLAPLSPDVVPAKLADYDRIWNEANSI